MVPGNCCIRKFFIQLLLYLNCSTRKMQLINASVFPSYVYSATPLLPKNRTFEAAMFCGCTLRFMLNLFGNPDDRLCHDLSVIIFTCLLQYNDRLNKLDEAGYPSPSAEKHKQTKYKALSRRDIYFNTMLFNYSNIVIK